MEQTGSPLETATFSFEPVGIDHDVALRWHIQASGRSYDFEIRLTGSETGGTSTKHHYFFGETSFERINLDIHYTFLQGFDPFILRSDGQGPTASIIGSPVLVPTGSVSPNANQTLDLYPTTLE